MRWIVIFEVDAPNAMTSKDITDVFSDAMLESFERNREDPTHPDFDCSDPQIEPAE
jgi:hypothetical protein